jgi:hypothetical protein
MLSALHAVCWRRVVLDEAQSIANPSTKRAKRCCSLRSRFRWCLSGSLPLAPLLDVVPDLRGAGRIAGRAKAERALGSLFRFLRVPSGSAARRSAAAARASLAGALAPRDYAHVFAVPSVLESLVHR